VHARGVEGGDRSLREHGVVLPEHLADRGHVDVDVLLHLEEVLADGVDPPPLHLLGVAVQGAGPRSRAPGLELREFALDLHDFAVGEIVALGQLAVELF
jgi:hypothetical protein